MSSDSRMQWKNEMLTKVSEIALKKKMAYRYN
jgi:hypothetical protein